MHRYLHRDASLGDEGYALSITPERAELAANTDAGLFYGMQTLAQLRVPAGTLVHSMQIRDAPRFRWRGVHLDTARHFFSVRTIEQFVAVAAHYKLNVLHWHLTDDQSWRLPVPDFPRLTGYAPSYSARDVREIVGFAARRHVLVVPEIEMPSHSSSAIAAYPQFGCGSGTLCNNAAARNFIETALARAFTLFPAPFVHIGGDEVPAGYNEPAFILPVVNFARRHGRRAIGWSEILSSGLATNAIVEAWDSMRRAAAAAQHGNDAIVSGWPLYFDAAQGDPAQEPRATRHVSTLAQVYAWDVMPSGLTSAQQQRILGGESALWTERIRTADHLFYMQLPRELALAEILWTPRIRKNWQGFVERLPAQFAWLDANAHTFRIPNASIEITGGPTVYTPVAGRLQTLSAWTTAPRVTLALFAPIDGTIRYAFGSDPGKKSAAYSKPLILNLSPGAVLDVRAATYFHDRRGAISECVIHRASAAAMPRANTSRSWAALVSP